MDYQVTFAAQADRDLEAIVRFLAQKNPTAAERLGHAVVDDALTLTDLPYRGVAVSGATWLQTNPASALVSYFFRIDEDRRLVEVARIWDARQDPETFRL